ncbi:MAG: galactose mutarotase [Erysipelotrichaceae bacterium]|nr:galactose mutarotase [Erysipelotrichaceae bacterium]
MKKESFGFRRDGREAFLYTIENEKIALSVTDHGAAVVSVFLKDAGHSVVQGGVSVEAYENELRYMGGSIGRTANRIAEGRFELNGKAYQLPVNNGPNCNHGGNVCFCDRLWETEMQEDSILMTLVSEDGDQGFPGTLQVRAEFRLLKDGFSISYEGLSDQDTLFAMTNHAYFNLNGPRSESVMDHIVQTDAAYFYPVDADGLTHEPCRSVENTPFDFLTPHSIGERFDLQEENLKAGNGYDHCFPVKGSGMRRMVTCCTDRIRMDIYADTPAFHMYTANYLDGSTKLGIDGGTFPARSSVCFEMEYVPDAVHMKDAEKPVLKAGEIHRNTYEYRFAVKGQEL